MGTNVRSAPGFLLRSKRNLYSTPRIRISHDSNGTLCTPYFLGSYYNSKNGVKILRTG